MREIEGLQDFLSDTEFSGSSQIEPIKQEASARRYYRIRSERSSAILCITTPIPDPLSDDFLSLRDFLDNSGVPVPSILKLENQKGWILQSDGGEKDLSEALKHHSENKDRKAFLALLDRTIGILAKMHSLPRPHPVDRRFFDFEKLNWEMEFLSGHLENLCRRLNQPSPLSFEMERFLKELCGLLEKSLASSSVFTHRDFHARNILVSHEENEPGLCVVDFQDARTGLPWYDLSSLLYDPYTPFHKEDREYGFLSYTEAAGLTKPGKALYHAQALQRVLKAIGTYVFLVFEKGMTGYFASIPEALDRAEEIIQLGRFPDSCYVFMINFKKYVLPAAERLLLSGAP